MSGRAVVVGAGFGGLATASLLAKDGWQVTVVEKNDSVGGRARYWREKGFAFDIGPSWYLMPEPCFVPRRYLVPIKTAADMYNWTAATIAADPFVAYRRKVQPRRARILLGVLANVLRGAGDGAAHA
jgi:phytoene dehydrogenase-like protein